MTKKSAARYFRPVISPRSSVLVIGLALLAVLGHVCELPVYPIVTAHAHQAADHSPDHHSGESQISCDPLAGVRPSTCAYPQCDLNADALPSLAGGRVPFRVAATTLPESGPLLWRRPLFLLHASFLI